MPDLNPVPLIVQHRDRLAKLPPEAQQQIIDALFRTYLAPKLRETNPNMSPTDLEQVRVKFSGSLLGAQTPPLDLGDKTRTSSLGDKALAFLTGGGAGVAGALRHLTQGPTGSLTPSESGLNLKNGSNLPNSDISPKKPGQKFLQNLEAKAYDEAQLLSPGAASAGAGVGHVIPATIAGSTVAGMIPKAAEGAPTAVRVAQKFAEGSTSGGAFEASRPGGDPESGMLWGGVIDAAFPIIGHWLGRGRKPVAPVARAATTPVATEAAPVAQTVTQTVKPTVDMAKADLKDIIAQEKFGKSFDGLTAQEKAQLGPAMRERLTKMKVEARAAKKAAAVAAKEAKATAASGTRRAEAEAKLKNPSVKPVPKTPVEPPVQTGQVSAATPTPSPVQAASPVPNVVAEAQAKQAIAENPNLSGAVASVKEVVPSVSDSAVEKLARGERTLTKAEALSLFDTSRIGEGKPLVSKVPEGVVGKIPKEAKAIERKAKGAERKAVERKISTHQQQAEALESIARQQAGRYTPQSISGLSNIDLEDALVESAQDQIPGIKKLLQKYRGSLSEEAYRSTMLEWLAKLKGIDLR